MLLHVHSVLLVGGADCEQSYFLSFLYKTRVFVRLLRGVSTACAEEAHLWIALRYVELNPVRAGMVESAAHWSWSSAGAHCGTAIADATLEMTRWRKRWTAAEWRQYLEQGESASDLSALRRATHTGRPLGTSEFVAGLEKLTARPLAPQKGGRPKKAAGAPAATRACGMRMKVSKKGETSVCPRVSPSPVLGTLVRLPAPATSGLTD